MNAVNPNIKFAVVLVIFLISMAFFGAVFGGVIHGVDKDSYNKNKDIYKN